LPGRLSELVQLKLDEFTFLFLPPLTGYRFGQLGNTGGQSFQLALDAHQQVRGYGYGKAYRPIRDAFCPIENPALTGLKRYFLARVERDTQWYLLINDDKFRLHPKQKYDVILLF
jgi:hypothetical protein